MEYKFFKELYENHYKDLHRYAISLTHNSHIADEHLQEAFLRVWINIDKLKNHENIKGWLINTIKYINMHHNEDSYRKEQFDYDY